ncbi:MAG: hypothetical protein PSU94_03975 [Lacunisphaera sp.]|nr:hypothetical protein [Lacunisphaera sp.]
MNDAELAECHAAFEVTPEVSLEELERAFMKKNFALLKGKSGSAAEANPALDAERQKLRAAYEKLAEHLREKQRQAEAAAPRKRPSLAPMNQPVKAAATRPPMTPLTAPPMAAPVAPVAPKLPSRAEREAKEGFALFAFDNWLVNLLVPPLLLGLVWAVTISPVGFFLKGFHVWMHEFGHATAAWLCGFRATPLPFGWTPVEPTYSPFVYWGLLLMFGILFAAGVKERKVWPMLAAILLGLLQYYMTWKMPPDRQEFWWSAFGGVGGEFYLGTLFMLSFFVQLPDKFKWGACRYVFFFIGATAFLNIWLRWGEIHKGLEEIPFGSMINGEDDQGGDMNKLMDGFGWKKVDIRNNYYRLGLGCWAALGLMWAMFALRLNKLADKVVAKTAGQ